MDFRHEDRSSGSIERHPQLLSDVVEDTLGSDKVNFAVADQEYASISPELLEAEEDGDSDLEKDSDGTVRSKVVGLEALKYAQPQLA